MGDVEYSTELTKIHHTNYVRNTRAVAVLWAIFTVVYLVLNIVVFLQPQWIGDTGDSAVAGFLGLFRYCTANTLENDYTCTGDFVEFDAIYGPYFKTAAIMVCISCIFFIICVGCFLLFCLLNTATVLRICGWFQLISGLLMMCACVIYPAGWDEDGVRTICSREADKYDLGECGIRWAYILAIVLVFDAFILAALAFVLAAKQARLLPEVYKSEKDMTK